MSIDYFSPDNVLVVTFGEEPENDKNGYQALTHLKQLDSQGQIKIVGAALITRDLHGRVDVKSGSGTTPTRHRDRRRDRPARRDHRPARSTCCAAARPA